jgi:hypothetical protein
MQEIMYCKVQTKRHILNPSAQHTQKKKRYLILFHFRKGKFEVVKTQQQQKQPSFDFCCCFMELRHYKKVINYFVISDRRMNEREKKSENHVYDQVLLWL